MLEDRYYMRQSSFDSRRSATVMLLIALAVAFVAECVFYGYPPRPGPRDFFALSVDGIRHGYVWQLLTYQFMHAGILHLLLNCWAIFVFGRELEMALGPNRFLTLYFGSGVLGGLLQVLAGSLWPQFAGTVIGASAGAFGLVAAFAVLYPERPLTLLLFFIIPVSMPAKFLLLISGLLAIFGILFPANDLANVAHLGGMLTGILFVRYALHWEWKWPQLGSTRRRSSRRLGKIPSERAPRWARRSNPSEDLPADEFLSKEVDPILDKISAHGIQSLTERERRILEAARTKMAKR